MRTPVHQMAGEDWSVQYHRIKTMLRCWIPNHLCSWQMPWRTVGPSLPPWSLASKHHSFVHVTEVRCRQALVDLLACGTSSSLLRLGSWPKARYVINILSRWILRLWTRCSADTSAFVDDMVRRNENGTSRRLSEVLI